MKTLVAIVVTGLAAGSAGAQDRIAIGYSDIETVADANALYQRIVHAAGAKAPDFVVFAEPGDMTILGARSLEGLNVRVDSQRKQLVPAGPILAGTAS